MEGSSDQTEARILSAKARLWLSVGVLIAAGLVAYANCYRGVFLLDDTSDIVKNQTIRHIIPLSRLFAGGRGVVMTSLAVNYAVDGLHVAGYHAVNLLIHLLAALALFGVVRRTLLALPRFAPHSTALALAAALLWEVHPIQTESVTYIIQRYESLAGLFYLLTLYCVIRGAQSPRRAAWHIAAIAACALGMASKEVMATAPLVVLLYDRIFLSQSWREALRARWKLYLALVLSVGLVASRVAALFDGSVPSAGFHLKGLSVWEYARTQPGVVLHYLRLTFWPQGLALDTGWPVAATVAAIVLPGLVIAALLVLTAYLLVKRPAWGFLGAWFFVILAPTSSILPIADLAVEHRMYLPLAAVSVAVVMGVFVLAEEVARRRPSWAFALSHRVLPAALIVTAVLLATLTLSRNRDYQSEVGFWAGNLARCPDNPRVHHNLGAAYVHAGRYDLAVAEFNKTLDMKPDYADAYYNRGIAYAGMGRCELTVSDESKAIELKPDHSQAYYSRAMACTRMGRNDQALRDYDKAIELNPDYAEAYLNRGSTYADAKKYDEALRDYDRAIELKPDYAEAYYNRATAYGSTNRYDLAISDYTEVIDLRPNYVEAYHNRGNTYAAMGRFDLAIRDYDKALDLKPGYGAVYGNRGNAHASMRRFDAALRDYDEAVRLKPDYVEAFYNRGNVQADLGKRDLAVRDYGSAINLKPDFALAYFNRGITYAEDDHYDLAIRDYSKVIELTPDFAPAYGARAAAYARLKQNDKALADAQTCQKLGGRVNPDLLKPMLPAPAPGKE